MKSHEKMQRFLKAVIRRFPLDVSMHRRIKSLKIRKILDILLLIPALIYFIYLYCCCYVETHIKHREYNYDFAIVAIVKNEGSYFKEWIDYHRILWGVRYIIYDNDSNDNTKHILEPYITRGIVIYHSFPGKKLQYDAYNDALNRYGKNYKYMAFLDLDEFIYCQADFRQLLDKTFEENHLGGLGINWRIFGSANHKSRLDGLVLENYLYRAEYNFKKNLHIKSVIKAYTVIGFCDPHAPVYMPGYYSVSADGEKLKGSFSKRVSIEKIAINHYFTKSYDEFVTKRNRGKADQVKMRPMSEFEEHDKNEVYDDGMLKYINTLKTNI